MRGCRDAGGMAWRGDGRSDDAMRVAERAVRDEGRTVFVSSIWSFPCCHRPAWGPRGVLGLFHRELI